MIRILLAIVVACIVTVMAQHWYIEQHLKGVPTAWFALEYDIGGSRGAAPKDPSVIGGPFKNDNQCEQWLKNTTNNSYEYGCHRMRIEDAKKQWATPTYP